MHVALRPDTPRRQPLRAWASLAATIALSLPNASAQPVAPAQANPGVLQEQLRRLAPGPNRTEESTAPISTPRPVYPPGAEGRQVLLRVVEISGNMTLTTEELSGAWAELQGRELPVTALYDLAFALSSSYRNRGYVLSTVIVEGNPVAEGLPDGVLRLRVVEGYVGSVTFDPEQAASPRIRKMGEVLTTERPLSMATFERQMLLINDTPGVSAQAYIAPTPTPGEAAVTIAATRERVSGLVGVQNRVSELLGNVLIEGRLTLNNALGFDEGQSLLLQTTDKDRLTSIGYAYDQPIGTSGLAFNAFLAHIESKSSLTQANLFAQSDELSELVRSKSDIVSLGLTYPLIRSRTESLRLRGRLNIYDGDQHVDIVELNQKERVRALRFGANWDVRDASGLNFADAEVSQGLSGLGSTSSDSPNAIRRNADYDFTKFNYTLGRLQHLGGSFSLLASIQGQWTNDRLPSSERYALGGEVILRAFDAGDLIGDRANAAKLELRYEPVLIPGGTITFYAFAEYGRTTSIEVAPLQNFDAEGADAGLGVRGSLAGGLNFYAELAKPYLRNPSSTDDRGIRVFAGLSYQF